MQQTEETLDPKKRARKLYAQVERINRDMNEAYFALHRRVPKVGREGDDLIRDMREEELTPVYAKRDEMWREAEALMPYIEANKVDESDIDDIIGVLISVDEVMKDIKQVEGRTKLVDLGVSSLYATPITTEEAVHLSWTQGGLVHWRPDTRVTPMIEAKNNIGYGKDGDTTFRGFYYERMTPQTANSEISYALEIENA